MVDGQLYKEMSKDAICVRVGGHGAPSLQAAFWVWADKPSVGYKDTGSHLQGVERVAKWRNPRPPEPDRLPWWAVM